MASVSFYRRYQIQGFLLPDVDLPGMRAGADLVALVRRHRGARAREAQPVQLRRAALRGRLAHERRGPRVPVLQHAVEGHREELEGVRRVEGGVKDRLRVAALGPPTPVRLMRIKRRAFGPFG